MSPTSNFALLPSSEHYDIGEEHKTTARNKRKQSSQPKIHDIFSSDLKIQAVGILKDELEYQPIIFEEVFTMDKDPKFV